MDFFLNTEAIVLLICILESNFEGTIGDFLEFELEIEGFRNKKSYIF